MLRFLFGTGVLCVLALSWLPLQLQAQSTPTAAQQMNLQSVANVNMAGRQRMLAQRMTKAYLMLGQSIDPEGAQAILQESIRLFDAQLDALKSLPPNAARCKPLLTAYPTKLGADLLYDLSEELQQAAHHVTLGYRNAGILPLDQLVNLAGRQRMLSQRMMKFYLYETWDINSAPADMEMHLARAHFTAVLLQMEKSPLTHPKIKAQVAELRRVWEPYQTVLFARRDAARMRQDALLAAGLSERVLESTEKLVAMLVEMASIGDKN